MTRYNKSMREVLFQIREGYSPKEIKMAISSRETGQREFTIRSKDTRTWETGIWIPNEKGLQTN